VASFIFISLDGFYEGPNGELDWPNVDAEFNDFAVRQLDEADTLGFGRATYEHVAALLADRAGHGERPGRHLADERQGEARLLHDAHRRKLVRDHRHAW
jgi:dihydrofolate reductase